MRGATSSFASGLAVICALAWTLPHQAWSGQSVPVPRTVIYSGTIILDAALEERVIELGRTPEQTWHMSRSGLVGKVARRTLLPGQLIPLLAVKEPDLVKAGKPVALVFVAGQLTITGIGIALQAGGPGDRISAQNTESGALVRGVISHDGSLRVGD
jgi:flagella basal body P-ring formation protein FlgA